MLLENFTFPSSAVVKLLDYARITRWTGSTKGTSASGLRGRKQHELGHSMSMPLMCQQDSSRIRGNVFQKLDNVLFFCKGGRPGIMAHQKVTCQKEVNRPSHLIDLHPHRYRFVRF